MLKKTIHMSLIHNAKSVIDIQIIILGDCCDVSSVIFSNISIYKYLQLLEIQEIPLLLHLFVYEILNKLL